MNEYFIGPSISDPEKAFYIEMKWAIPAGVLDLFFPFWRPGRYEPGNFVKWSRNFKVIGDGDSLYVAKIKPNHWRIESNESQTIQVSYEWCIHELNAGSSFLSDTLFYVNPVNLFCFIKQKEMEPIRLTIELKDNWNYAGGLPIQNRDSKIYLEAKNFDHLADSPFFFAPLIHSFQWQMNGTQLNCHSAGEPPKAWSNGDYSSLIQFTEYQIRAMNGLPCSEYHYMFVFTPHRMRHGVEHWNSTMIVMGQGDVDDDIFYDEVLSISSHELFHTWNVKYCRPMDLLPYDYTQAQYTSTGMITEGITTYYGELMLWRSGVWSWEKMAQCILDWLNVHVNNAGRFSSSLLDSSIDTWVDGYVKGTPGRKVSIYNEGALLAFLTDVFILQSSNGEKSMDDVMLALIANHNINGVGYTLEDYWNTVQSLAGVEISHLGRLASTPSEYTSEVMAALDWIGQKWVLTENESQRFELISNSIPMNNKLCGLYRCPQL